MNARSTLRIGLVFCVASGLTLILVGTLLPWPRVLWAEQVHAGENSCVGCHTDGEQVGTDSGLYIAAMAYDASPHGSQPCEICHGGNSVSMVPSEAHEGLVANPGADPVRACGGVECHRAKFAEPDVHRDQGKLICGDCHTGAEIHGNGEPLSCITCHADDISG